jgi:hypothetical protein
MTDDMLTRYTVPVRVDVDGRLLLKIREAIRSIFTDSSLLESYR